MRIAVTATSADPSGELDSRFGRAALFLVFDSKRGAWEAVENTVSLNAAQGAGIQAAECVARIGAEVVLTGHCGPKAHRALVAAGVGVCTGLTGSAEDAVQRFLAGRLALATEPDVQGHW